MKGYPKWFSPIRIKIFFFILTLSGLLLLPTFLEFKFELSIPWRLSTPQRNFVSYFHYLLGMLSLFLISSLWSIHMRREWRRKLKRISGSILCIVSLLLFFTSSGILYLGDETLSNYASITHTALGFIFILILVIHFLKPKAT